MNKYLSLVALLLIGCGSSSEPKQPDNNQPTQPGPQPTAAPAARTLITRPLLMTSPQNLLLDIGFRDAGWGHFTSFYDGFSAQVSVTTRTFSVSPASVTAPIGIFKDTAATDEKSKGMISLCSFLGGNGPFVARVWVSRSNVAGDPLELEEDPTVFRAALTTGGYPEGKAYDLARKDVKVLGGRQWVLFEARVEATLPSTAFFNLKFGRRGGAFMVQAPDVIAEPLMGGDKTMALTVKAAARAVTADEGAAIAAYVRQPHQLGLEKVPVVIPQ